MLFQDTVTGNMIRMPVRVENRSRLAADLLQCLHDPTRLQPRIND